MISVQWKAYSALLARIDHFNPRITFGNFTLLMVKNYPKEIQKKIVLAAAAVLNRTDMMNDKNSWIHDAGVLTTDFVNLNKIRVTYFRVEQSVS